MVVPILFGTTPGVGWSVTLAAGAPDVSETVSEELVLVAVASKTRILAIPAELVVSVALALPPLTGTVATEEVVPFQTPVVVAKLTLVEVGALTSTISESPIFMEVTPGLPEARGTPFSVN